MSREVNGGRVPLEDEDNIAIARFRLELPGNSYVRIRLTRRQLYHTIRFPITLRSITPSVRIKREDRLAVEEALKMAAKRKTEEAKARQLNNCFRLLDINEAQKKPTAAMSRRRKHTVGQTTKARRSASASSTLKKGGRLVKKRLFKSSKKGNPGYSSSITISSDDSEREEEGMSCRDQDDHELVAPAAKKPADQWLSGVWKGEQNAIPHFTCEVCGASFDKKFEFTKHLFEHRKEEQKEALTCQVCSVTFHSQEAIDDHYERSDHGSGKTFVGKNGKPQIGKFKCFHCPSRFTHMNYLRKHLEIHKRPTHMCLKCFEEFSYGFELTDHVKFVHKDWTSMRCELNVDPNS